MPVKPTPHEEAFFARQEAERTRDLARIRADAIRAKEREERRALHWMHCPKCGEALAEVAFRDQRVDRCVACGGVWLDAGELEALARKEGGFLEGLRAFFAE